MIRVLILFCLLCLSVGGILAWLRFAKGYLGLKRAESELYPYQFSPGAIVSRLNGLEHHAPPIHEGKLPRFDEKTESLVLPLNRWRTGDMNMARVAVISHTWAHSLLAKQDPLGHRQRERAVVRARLVPILALFMCLVLAGTGRISPMVALTLLVVSWTLTAMIAIPSQFREWKAIAIAKTGLKEAGLYPQSRDEAAQLNRALSSLAWCRVAGFRHLVPK